MYHSHMQGESYVGLAALDRYRDALVLRLAENDDKGKISPDAPETLPNTDSGEPADTADTAPIEAELPIPPSRSKRRTMRASLANITLLVVVLVLMIVGVILLGQAVSVVAERGLYRTKWDDTTFNGIKLHLKD